MVEEFQVDGVEYLKSLGLNDLSKSVIGHYLIGQLYQYQFEGPGNPDVIVREIKSIDQVTKFSKTKKESIFKGNKLAGFHHKHYTTAYDIAYNILQHNLHGTTGELNKSVERVFSRILNSDKTDEQKSMLLADYFTMQAYSQRSKSRSLTGNWIIYKKHNGTNYFLGIAPHNQDTDSIYDALHGWYVELWPFLFNKKM